MKKAILVVDDSPTIRKVVSTILRDHGYHTLAADNGEDALTELRRAHVDLVLIDFVMPKMNGYQFCREVRSDPALKDLPVVLMSAKGDKIRGQFVKQTGAIDAITKPFDPLGLIAVVEGALTKSEEHRSRADQARPSDPPSYEEPPSIDLSAAFEAEEDSGDERRAVLSGVLSFISIAEILQLLELQRQTGALRVSNEGSDVTLFVREGLLDFARSRGMPPNYRLGRYLVQTGALQREDVTNFVKKHAGTKRLIGDALVQAGLVTEEQITEALRRQTSELVYDVVSWRKGRFYFLQDATSPEATLAQLGLPPGGIVMEGFRRVDEWRLIEGSFDFDEVLHRDQVAVERMGDKGTLTDTERAVLEAIDGKRTVREVVDNVEASTFDVCKILYQFLNSHLVRRRAA